MGRVHSILCLPEKKILIAQKKNNRLNCNKTIKLLEKQIFLGQRQLFGKKNINMCLQAEQASKFITIGIQGNIGHHYHKGLMTAATKKNPIDVFKIHKHIQKKIMEIRTSPNSELAQDAQALLQGLQFCRQAQIATIHKPNLLKLLYKEHNIQLSQLGMLVLPAGFISTLREPVLFVDTIGKKLGRLVELLCHTRDN